MATTVYERENCVVGLLSKLFAVRQPNQVYCDLGTLDYEQSLFPLRDGTRQTIKRAGAKIAHVVET